MTDLWLPDTWEQLELALEEVPMPVRKPDPRNDLPEQLRLAILVAASDPDANVPLAGTKPLRDWVLGVTSERPEHLDNWLETQAEFQQRAAELLARVELDPSNLPDFFLEDWFRTLSHPWAENLMDAVLVAETVL